MAKTVIITGGSRGIGAACARKYAENGFNVVVVGRDSKVYFSLSNFILNISQPTILPT